LQTDQSKIKNCVGLLAIFMAKAEMPNICGNGAVIGAMKKYRHTDYFLKLKCSRNIVKSAGWLIIAPVLFAGCVNTLGTSSPKTSELESKKASHEERYVAGKCNSAERLKNSNLASQALTTKYTAYNVNENKLDVAKKEKINTDLQTQGAKLQELDLELKTQCTAYTACEFQASTTKQDCSVQKSKFLDADKKLVKLTKNVNKIRIN
jgi:hypothetical protein